MPRTIPPSPNGVVHVGQSKSHFVLGLPKWLGVDVSTRYSVLPRIMYAIEMVPFLTGRLESRTDWQPGSAQK